MKSTITIKFPEKKTKIFISSKSEEFLHDSKIIVIADSHSSQYNPCPHVKPLIIGKGEHAKSSETVELILMKAHELHFDRNSWLVAVGGGVVSDVVAFAASQYMRGVKLLIVPTTLIGMVDASIGGKTAINKFGVRNLLGTFYPANEVHIYPSYLATLDQMHYRAGYAEIIKAAFLGDDILFSLLENERDAIISRDPKIVEKMIVEAVKFKARFVTKDPYDLSIRKFLNLGHTFAHGLETIYPHICHGEAVAWGLARAIALSEKRKLLSSQTKDTMISLLLSYGFTIDLPALDTQKILYAIQHDKKKNKSIINCILLENIGNPIIVAIEPDELLEIMSLNLSE